MIKTCFSIAILLIFTCIFTAKMQASSPGIAVHAPYLTENASIRQVEALVYDTICMGDTVVLSAPDNMLSYLWSNDSTAQSIEISPDITSWFWVEIMNQDSIVSRDSTLVSVLDFPEIISSSEDTIVMSAGNDTILWVEVTDGSDIMWSTGETTAEITISPFENTDFSVEVSNQGHCSVSHDFFVEVNYSIDISFSYDTVCQGDTTLLINTSQTNDSITHVLWDLNSDGQFNDYEGDTVKWVFNESGTPLVGMRLYFKISPLQTTYNAVPVGSYPQVDFEFSNTCQNSTTLFNDLTVVTSGRPYQWFWEFGDGKSDFFENTSNYYVFPGTYSVKLNVVTDFGCADSTTKSVTITEAPQFDFITGSDSIVPADDTAFFAKGATLVVFVNVTGAYDSVEWYNGSTNESISITETGVYNATVYSDGCPGEARFVAAYSGGGGGGGTGTEIMNMFTPNGDGFNDYWQVSNPDVTFPIKVTIYNRVGRSVYVSDDYQNDWSGKSEGNPLPQATYYYFIEDATGAAFKGPVTIIR